MNKKIGILPGVFDMFHIGHLNIIKSAKNSCDYLIVAVNTDEFVKIYKNKTTIIPYEQRAEIIRSLKYVDEVVPRNGEAEIDLIKNYNANIIFSGDDWKGSDRYKKLIEDLNLEKINAEIIYFKYTDGISTTLLKEKIKNL